MKRRYDDPNLTLEEAGLLLRRMDEETMNELLGLTPEDAALLLRVFTGDITMTDTSGAAYRELKNRLESHATLVVPPMGKDKVWHGMTTGIIKWKAGQPHQNQWDTVVRAKSAAEAVRMLQAAGERVSASHFSSHWGITSNRESLVQCTAPGVWVKGPKGWVKA